MAVAVLEKKQKSRRTPEQPSQGQPVYGMPGARYSPEGGFQ
jgi:hypothetical protein